MNMKLKSEIAAVFGALAIGALAPVPADASSLLGYFASANDCAGVFGTPPNCVATYVDPVTKDVLLEPTPLIVKIDYPLLYTLGNFTSITGTEFAVTLNADGSGSWIYTPGELDPVVTAFVIKDGNGFWLFESSGNSGSWAADQQQGGQGISHITFYDGGNNNTTTGGAEIPVPGTLALFGVGLLAGGFGMRRRRLAHAG